MRIHVLPLGLLAVAMISSCVPTNENEPQSGTAQPAVVKPSAKATEAQASVKATGGQWQGAEYPRQKDGDGRPDLFLLGDLGGTGNGFEAGEARTHLGDVDFSDRLHGWACGRSGVFKTSDGGLTWEQVKPAGDWKQIRAPGSNEVWLLQASDRPGIGKVWLLHSTDGGLTWNDVLHGKLGDACDLYARGSQCWVMCGPRSPGFRSRDSGQTWTEVDSQETLDWACRVALPTDPTNTAGVVAYALGKGRGQPVLGKSEDGGNTWTRLALPLGSNEDVARGCICFPTTSSGYVALGGSRILCTSDGGQTWQERKLPTSQGVIALWFDPTGRGFVSVDNSDMNHLREAVYRTLDGGQTWQPVLGGRKQILALCGRGRDQVWGVGTMPDRLPVAVVVILKPGGLN